jgi:ribonuclease P protein component
VARALTEKRKPLG